MLTSTRRPTSALPLRFPSCHRSLTLDGSHRQYTSFTKQRDELIARQDELDESSTSITELIEVLDARKDEAIERTFKQVAKNFEEVFEKLVPAGRGRLIMQRRQLEKVSDRSSLGRRSGELAGNRD